MFSMFGDWEMLSGAMMVTPELFEQLPGSAYISEPNLFLVKSSLGYFDAEGARELAISIEQALNDLNDDSSLSAQQGILLGATTRIVHDEVSAFWEVEAAFWDFLNIFSALGLIIGAMGMVIIAVRSVAERTREIGMMRAIGFQRKSVVFTVALELIFVSAVGLIAGVINGALMTQAFLSLMLEVPPAYPAKLLVTYVGGLVAMALLAGLLPGIRASRVPPSEALRYTG
jgi:putative ABC transport system permease protein